MSAQDPMDRLSSAFTVTVDPETKDRHLAEISRELRTAPPMPVPQRFGLRRRVAALAAALVVFAPAAMAVAADDAVPGDFLYPVKQATERVWGLFDDDIEATHRVEEVERLVFRRAPERDITHAVRRAESATAMLQEPAELEMRLEKARELLQRQNEQDTAERRQGDGDEQRSGSSNTGSGGSPGSTIAPGADERSDHPGGEHGGTTTTSGRGDAGHGDEGGASSTTEPPSSTTSPKAGS